MMFEYTGIILNQLHPAPFLSHKTLVGQRFIWFIYYSIK